MPTGTRPEPTPLTFAIASRLRGAMASTEPPTLQRDIEARTGIPQSTLSRYLRARKVMTVEQLDAICRAIGVSTGEVMDGALREVREQGSYMLAAKDVPFSREDENPFD